ncbi:MAG TPA: hypothetical protein VH112_14790 [Acidimicrobiales bacterium]|nr:hypothetical protein [Acidimicrobiales bacterium]
MGSNAAARPRPPRRRRFRCSPAGSGAAPDLASASVRSARPPGPAASPAPPRRRPLPSFALCLPPAGLVRDGGGAGRVSPIFGLGVGLAALGSSSAAASSAPGSSAPGS